MILRELFLKLGLDVDAQSFAKGELAAQIIEKGFEKIVDLAKDAVKQIFEVAEAGENLEKLAQVTGVSTQGLQNLQSAATAAGVATDDMTMGLRALSRQMFAAKNGSTESQQAFQRLGLKVRDAHGKMRSADEVLLDLADKFKKMPDGTEKTAQALEVLGRNGAALIPVLNKGRDGIAELANEFPNLTEEQIAAGAELVKTQKTLAAVTKNLWQQAVAPLLPAINHLLKRYLEWRKQNAAIMAQRIQKYIGYVIKAVEKLADLFTFLVKNGKMVEILIGVALVAAFSRIEDAAVRSAAAATMAWIRAAAPFIAIGAIIAGMMLIFDDLRVYQRGGKSLYGRFKKEIDEWVKPKANDPWFVTALKEFVHDIQVAIDLMKELDNALNRYNPKNVDANAAASKGEVARRADNQTIASAKLRVGKGLGLTPTELQALGRQGINPGSFIQQYTPSSAPPAALSAGIQQQNTIQIYQLPGESSTELANKVDDVLSGHLEDAAAAAGP